MGEPQEGVGRGGTSLTWVNHRKVGGGNQPDMGEPQEGGGGGGKQPDMGEPQEGGGGEPA